MKQIIDTVEVPIVYRQKKINREIKSLFSFSFRYKPAQRQQQFLPRNKFY